MQQNFTIPREPISALTKIFSIILVGDLLFALSVFLISTVRNSLEIDATLAGLYWGLFFIKAVLVLMGVFKIFITEMTTTYVVNDKQLSILDKDFNNTSENYSLQYIRSVKVTQSFLGKKFNYGDMQLNFSGSKYEESITLTSVAQPKKIATLIRSFAK